MRCLEGFEQVCYVTNDMAHGVEIMQREYDLPPFRFLDIEFPSAVGDVTGVFKLSVGVSRIEGLTLELIQPLRDVGDFYSQRLAPDRPAGLGLHHLGVRVRGDEGVWYERLAGLERRGRVYVRGEVGTDIKFVYHDERPLLGHFVEHYWLREQA